MILRVFKTNMTMPWRSKVEAKQYFCCVNTDGTAIWSPKMETSENFQHFQAKHTALLGIPFKSSVHVYGQMVRGRTTIWSLQMETSENFQHFQAKHTALLGIPFKSSVHVDGQTVRGVSGGCSGCLYYFACLLVNPKELSLLRWK